MVIVAVFSVVDPAAAVLIHAMQAPSMTIRAGSLHCAADACSPVAAIVQAR